MALTSHKILLQSVFNIINFYNFIMDESITDKGLRLISMANAHYGHLAPFRTERERNKRYNYGNQWSDIVDIDGRRITEEQYIKEQGSIPLKNNLIRRLVRNVVDVYNSRSRLPQVLPAGNASREAARLLGRILRHSMHTNRLSTMYTRSMEEFLISGMVVHRKSYGQRGGITGVWTDYVQPSNFFFDRSMRDFRGWDCSCVGEIHDISFSEVCRQMAHSKDKYELLKQHYGISDLRSETLCRVTEIWVKESEAYYLCHDTALGTTYHVKADEYGKVLDKENARRIGCGQGCIHTHWYLRDVWRYYFLAPDGWIMAEGDSPYRHGGHPYVFKVYPLIDGEIHSFVGDVIDQQRYTNRLITLYDWIMRASSKGVLLVPEDCVPRGCSPSDFADAWSKYNGVIFYKPSAQGQIPQQVANNSTNIGIRELLDVQLKFFEDISGVNEALQGRTSNVAMSAELFGKQTQNATTTLLDILDTFNDFVRDAAYKDVSNIKQYYPECAAFRDADVEIRVK